jgi:signal transduction histidine kinase
MSERRWFSSLYWRLALGLFAFLALMLVAQGALFLWITDRIAGSMPARDPRRLAELVASDVGAALSADPSLNLKNYIRDQYGNVFQTFVVVMDDGRVAANHNDVSPAALQSVVTDTRRRTFALRGRRPDNGGFSTGATPGAGAGAAAVPAGPRFPRRAGDFAFIVLSNAPVGRVAVLPGGPPFSRVLRQLGPTMGLVGGGVLIVGMGLITFVVFGPARRRLRHVQDAAERLGRGDLTARAPANGGDEVAAVAGSFNRMADELTARATALEAADRARRQLLADVSHELMTPLTAISGYVETLSMPELQLDAERRRRYLGIVTDETRRLERIIGDLLDLARLEGGGGTLRRERVDVAALFDRVAARHEQQMRTRAIALERRVDPEGLSVTGDPDRLEQALQNLAANALRHTPDGGAIGLTAAAGEGGVRLQVRDTGPGIAPEHLPLIFDRFYKVDAARKAAGGGSGLGLSIVKAIVERHGGTITAFNDRGAVFDIALPA